jgi:hypothetical protein
MEATIFTGKKFGMDFGGGKKIMEGWRALNDPFDKVYQ